MLLLLVQCVFILPLQLSAQTHYLHLFLAQNGLLSGNFNYSLAIKQENVSHRIMELFHICFYKKGLTAPCHTIQRRRCLINLHRYSVCCVLKDLKLLYYNKSGVCVRHWKAVYLRTMTLISCRLFCTTMAVSNHFTALCKGINSKYLICFILFHQENKAFVTFL